MNVDNPFRRLISNFKESSSGAFIAFRAFAAATFATTTLRDENDARELRSLIEADTKIKDDENFLVYPLGTRVKYFLRLLLEEKDCEAVFSYLYERYDRELQKRGRAQAEQWLYYEVARSMWPFLKLYIGRIKGRIGRTLRID